VKWLLLLCVACTARPTLWGKERGLDHVGIAVQDLDAAKKTFHDGLGFGGMEAGKLPNGIQNINYYFEDSTYLETFNYWDGRPPPREGFAVLSVESVQNVKQLLGAKVGEPIEGGIQTAREQSHWQTLFFARDTPLFFIEYPQPKRSQNLAKLEQAISSGRIYKHPNGALGIKAAWLAVPDVDAALKMFADCGMRAGEAVEEPRLGAKGRAVDAGAGKIFVVSAPGVPPGIFGLSVEVSIVGVAQGFVARFTQQPALVQRGVLGDSVWVQALGTSLEFFQR
jgi:catechol 2,3-dioxygenase-like lactoylglutathione lyase family enzyme